MWSTFFDPPVILAKMKLTKDCRNVVDFGCGYGTFSIPAARIVRGTVFALDIDAEMVGATAAKTSAEGLTNVEARQRDFVADGTGLPEGVADYAMLFNILHAEAPEVLLREAWRVLGAGGLLGIIHWNYDPATPRGPGMAIRPRPQQCLAWAQEVGFRLAGPKRIDLPPYHYGIVMTKALQAG
jgi:SAM-dependent methyltransferase